MELSNVLGNMTPTIMPVTVFSATVINKGALLVSGATTTAQGATVTVTTTTASNENFIGVTAISSSDATGSKENLGQNASAWQIDTDGFPNQGTTGGLDFLPLIINPDAAYFALYSTTTGSGTASDTVGTFTASTTTDVSRGSTGTDVLGGWLFSLAGVNSAGNTPTFSGSLRYISNQSATTALTLLTAMNVSTDSHMIWADRTWKKAGQLNSTADQLRSASAASGTGLKQNGARMVFIENYISHTNSARVPLRQWIHDGLNSLTSVRIYGETVFTSPFLQDKA